MANTLANKKRKLNKEKFVVVPDDDDVSRLYPHLCRALRLEYLRFLSKAKLFWLTLNSSYNHCSGLCNLMAARRGNNKVVARRGQQGKIADATINSR